MTDKDGYAIWKKVDTPYEFKFYGQAIAAGSCAADNCNAEQPAKCLCKGLKPRTRHAARFRTYPGVKEDHCVCGGPWRSGTKLDFVEGHRFVFDERRRLSDSGLLRKFGYSRRQQM